MVWVTREIFLNKKNLKYKDIELDGLGTARIVEFSGKSRLDFFQTHNAAASQGRAEVTLAAETFLLTHCLCDETFTPIITQSEFDKFCEMQGSHVIQQIVDAALEINALKGDQQKNSVSDQNAVSHSA